MATRFFISSHRNCRRFLAVTHHAAILNYYSHDLQALHFTVERGEKMQRLFLEYRIRDWRTFYLAMSRKMNKPELADMFPTGP